MTKSADFGDYSRRTIAENGDKLSPFVAVSGDNSRRFLVAEIGFAENGSTDYGRTRKRRLFSTNIVAVFGDYSLQSTFLAIKTATIVTENSDYNVYSRPLTRLRP